MTGLACGKDISLTEFLSRTLHKIHTFVEAQQDGSKIKYLFRQGEMNTLLKACHTGLDTALEVFKVYFGHQIGHNTHADRYRLRLGQWCSMVSMK
jgi:hypothetical protein